MQIDIWKAIVGILGSMIMTGLVSWFSFGMGTATKAEVLVATEKNEKKVDLNTKAINGLQVILGRIETKMDNVEDLLREHRQEDHGR